MTNIPPSAKLVFDGLLFKIYQWKQKMLDGSYKTFEAAKRDDNAQVLTTINNKVILIKEFQPNFKKFLISVPGGNVDYGETPQNAAMRELFEETGIKCENLVLFAKDEAGSKLKRDFFLYIGYGAKKIGEPKNSSGESIEVLELDFEDFITETQKADFRNPKLQQIVKNMLGDSCELEEFRKLLFSENTVKIENIK